MKRRWIRWTLGAVVAVAALVAIRVTLAFIAPPPRADPPVAMHGGDVYGDPLPEGAVARLGTIRFRGKGPAVWAPDGERLLVGGWNDEIFAMNAKTGLVEWTLPGHSQPFMRNIDVTDFDEMWRVVQRGELPLVDDVCSGLTLFPDGRRLLSQGYSLRIWDLPSHAEVKVIPLRGGTVSGGRISPDGTLYAFAWIASVRIVDLVAGREKRSAHVGTSEGEDQNQVQCVAWSGDGARVFAGLQDGRVAVVSVERAATVYFPLSDCAIDALLVADAGRALWTLDHKGALTIRSLASPNVAPRRIDLGVEGDPKKRWWHGTLTASPDGRVVAAHVDGRKTFFFDAATASPVVGPDAGDGASPIGWSPDGRLYAGWSHGAVRVFGDDAPAPIDVGGNAAAGVAWSPDGRRVATIGHHWWGASDVVVWDAATGRRLWERAVAEPSWRRSIAWTTDGREVRVAARSRITALDAETGAERWSHSIEPTGPPPAWPTLSEDGESAAWTDAAQDLHFLDLRGERRESGVAHLGTKPSTQPPRGCVVLGPADAVLVEWVPTEVHPNGSWSGKTEIRRWHAGESSPVFAVDAAGDDVCVATRDAGRVAVGDSQIAVYDLASVPPREVGRTDVQARGRDGSVKFATAAALSPDGSLLAVGDGAGTIRVWSVPACALVRTLRGHRGQIECLAFSPDGARLVSGSIDATALVWSLK